MLLLQSCGTRALVAAWTAHVASVTPRGMTVVGLERKIVQGLSAFAQAGSQQGVVDFDVGVRLPPIRKRERLDVWGAHARTSKDWS